MSTLNKFKRRLDSDAVLRACRRAPALLAAKQEKAVRRKIRRELSRLGYFGPLLDMETERLARAGDGATGGLS